MNAIFTTREFWQAYSTSEPEGLSAEDAADQMELLGRDFVVRSETLHFEYEGRPHTATRRVVDFGFSCGDRFSLVIEYELKPDGCTTTVYLSDSHSGARSQMGWSDLAQWHPYCLRLEELDSLLRYWHRFDVRWQIRELPLLLLCQFVAIPEPDALSRFEDRVQVALQALGVPGPIEFPLRVPEDDTHWKLDGDLGWTFTNDEYPCYSIRNRAHAGSGDECFPFTAFGEMIAEVRSKLDRMD